MICYVGKLDCETLISRSSTTYLLYRTVVYEGRSTWTGLGQAEVGSRAEQHHHHIITIAPEMRHRSWRACDLEGRKGAGKERKGDRMMRGE
jgi:hypothetical protein